MRNYPSGKDGLKRSELHVKELIHILPLFQNTTQIKKSESLR